MDPRLASFDWEQAFEYTKGADPVPGFTGSTEAFGRDDVAHVYSLDEGENDGRDWIVVGELNDGRWFFLSAGCDYTGWDCRASGRTLIAGSKAAILRLGMTVEERRRLLIDIDGAGVSAEGA